MSTQFVRGFSNTVFLKAYIWQMQGFREVETPNNPMESQRAALVTPCSPHPRTECVLFTRGKGPACQYLYLSNTVDYNKLHESFLVNI